MITLLPLFAAHALAADVPFPREKSDVHDTVLPPFDLGPGGGSVLSERGNRLTDRYSIGATTIIGLDLEFSMDDQTTSACPVGTLTFQVMVNGTRVGSFAYAGGATLGTIQFVESYTFPPINGGGPGDTYKVKLVADDTVCAGGGGYNYFPGGTATWVLPDSDGDGLTDLDEINLHGTDPSNPDTDGGGVNDGPEVLANGTDPLDPSDDITDSDGDSVPDDEDVCPGSNDTFDIDADGSPDACDPCPIDPTC